MSTREDFEAWAISVQLSTTRYEGLGGYAFYETRKALESWQAATSRQKAKIKALEQAIAQEQKPLFKVLIDKHPGLADELASQSANTNLVVSQKPAETKPLLPNCFNCKHSETPCNSATCRDCKHAYSSIDNWEPKP